MKEEWNRLSQVIGEYNELTDEFANGLQEPRVVKAYKKVLDKWNHIVRLHNEFDKVVEPIQPIEFKPPFAGDDFCEMWQTYKEYLIEDYGMTIGSRREKILLSRLYKLSDKNVNRAISMLEFFIASGYKTIFKPSDKQIAGEEIMQENSPANFDLSQTIKTKL